LPRRIFGHKEESITDIWRYYKMRDIHTFYFSLIILGFPNEWAASVVKLSRVPGYRSRGPGSIHGATRFSEKQWVWNGVHSAS
jgi:hypothetical protein